MGCILFNQNSYESPSNIADTFELYGGLYAHLYVHTCFSVSNTELLRAKRCEWLDLFVYSRN